MSPTRAIILFWGDGAVSDDAISKLFSKVDEIRDDVSVIKTKMEEREKRDSENNHENRIKSLELWRAAQLGVSGFVKNWGPVVISVGLAVWASTRGGHG